MHTIVVSYPGTFAGISVCRVLVPGTMYDFFLRAWYAYVYPGKHTDTPGRVQLYRGMSVPGTH